MLFICSYCGLKDFLRARPYSQRNKNAFKVIEGPDAQLHIMTIPLDTDCAQESVRKQQTVVNMI